MNEYLTFIVRIILSLCLIYFSYLETGIWTAINLILIMINLEVISLNMKKSSKYNQLNFFLNRLFEEKHDATQ